MRQDIDELRALHARVLARQPLVSELPQQLQEVERYCGESEGHPVCRWAHDNLSDDDWQRIYAARTEEQRRAAERAEWLGLCRSGDEGALRAAFPGHAAFYDLVKSPPEFVERPMDAVVAIGISGNLVRKAKKVIERGMAREGLKVQYGGPHVHQYSPNRHASRNNTASFFIGYYTPEIEARMAAPRPDCARLKNSRFVQGGCRRDIVMSIVRDWLHARGHSSVRLIVSDQSAWPHYRLLVRQLLGDFDACIDTNFDTRLPRNTSLRAQMCVPHRGPGLWIDYEFYVNTLFQTD